MVQLCPTQNPESWTFVQIAKYEHQFGINKKTHNFLMRKEEVEKATDKLDLPYFMTTECDSFGLEKKPKTRLNLWL